MYYAIDQDLLSRLKALAAEDPTNAGMLDALSAAETEPLISSLVWKQSDVVAAARQLLQSENYSNTDGSRFDASQPFTNPAHERLAQEMAGDPDEFCVGIRDEVDNGIVTTLIDRVRDGVEADPVR